MDTQTRKIAAFATIWCMIALLGLGANAWVQMISNFEFFDFANYSFMEWVIQILYWILVGALATLCGSNVANDTY
jgi:hypothetical protein